MRARAQAVPSRKGVTMDEAGNPIPYVDRGARITGPVGRPDVQVHRVGTTTPLSSGGDDDRFSQG